MTKHLTLGTSWCKQWDRVELGEQVEIELRSTSLRSNFRRWMTTTHQRLDIKPDILTHFPVLPLLNSDVLLIHVWSFFSSSVSYYHQRLY